MLFGLALMVLFAGCLASGSLADDANPAPELAEPVSLHATPLVWYAFASVDPDVRPTVSLQSATSMLADDEGGPLSDALAAAGWSSDESAALVTLAAGHGSGAEHDATRARQLELRGEIANSFARFDSELAVAEAAEGTTVDREQLFEQLHGWVAQ